MTDASLRSEFPEASHIFDQRVRVLKKAPKIEARRAEWEIAIGNFVEGSHQEFESPPIGGSVLRASQERFRGWRFLDIALPLN